MRVATWIGVAGIVASVACGGPAGSPAGEGGASGGAAGTGAAAPAPEKAPPVEVTVPAGTAVSIRLASSVSTETATEGDAVEGEVAEAVVVGGRTVIPAGAMATGSVTDVVRPGRVKGRARLAVRFTGVTVGGERKALAATPVVRQGEATKSEDATKVGIGAGAGAAIGAILGGGKGAAKGAAVGAAGGTGVVLATRGKDVGIGKGEPVTVELTAPITVTVPGQS